MTGKRRYPVPLSIRLGSPVLLPAITIPGEAVKTRKRFLKIPISFDTDRQIITGLKISRHPVHDILHAEKIRNNATESDILTPLS
jgi:hypothetical protein